MERAGAKEWIPARLLAQASGMTGEKRIVRPVVGSGSIAFAMPRNDEITPAPA
jgi:hypothetical protein